MDFFGHICEEFIIVCSKPAKINLRCKFLEKEINFHLEMSLNLLLGFWFGKATSQLIKGNS